nr:hypothetical protein [Tanacetum cinerariifolium]
TVYAMEGFDPCQKIMQRFPLLSERDAPAEEVCTADKVKVIEFGDSYETPQEVADTGSASEGSAKKKGRTVAVTTEDMQKRRNDVKARTTLLLALPDEHQLRFSKYKTAQELWAAILKIFGGNEATKKTKKNQLKQQYGNFKTEGKETLEQTFNRLQAIVSHLKFMDVEIEQDDLNQKFLTSLAPEWLMYMIMCRNRSDFDTTSLDDLYNHLKVYEPEVQKKSKSNSQNMAFISSAKNSSGKEEVNTASFSTATTQVSPASADVKYKDINQIDEDDIEEIDIKWNMALLKENHALVADEEALTEFALMAKSSSKNKVKARLVGFKNQEIKFCEKIRGLEFKVEFKDNRIERLTKELEEIKKEKEGLDRKLTCFQSASKNLNTLLGSQRSDKNKEGLGYSIVPPPDQVYSPPKKDMSWTGLPEIADDTITGYRDSSDCIMSKPMIKIVKATDSPTEVKISRVKTVRKPSVKYAEIYRNTTKSPKDNGCSRHMTGNIFYLSNYEPYDGGYVSFRQGGGKITGKGIIKTGKLEFENMYFVKDLKYNLFSVSQICDNKNSVLFTDSKCIVLGRDFKLRDDTNVLLRSPRQHNMRLGHLNFKTMNKLVRHNLVRGLPSKCFENNQTYVACLKGKQHKASYKTKLVHSVSKPLHTLHMDMFGPTSDDTSGILRNFITEIENLKELKVKIIRVLVNNSQNKTPYELFNGRTPAIGFLKPFGYHVMILNTLDNLGKFDAKGDEGYFIGYSMFSKAFRNKLIEKGAGPNWLFDIDTLTNSMNYVPLVVAGTTSTNFLGTKDAASQDEKKDVSSLRYIALPNWFYEAHLESSTSNAQDTCNDDAPESSGNSNPNVTSTNPPANHMETLIVESPIPTVSSPVPTACLDDSLEPSSDTRLISKRVTSQDDTPSPDNILTLSNRFEDILGITTNTGATNGVEADLGNMENNISASPTPTFRTHKDHLKSQIISPVDTLVQTRTKSKEMEEHIYQMDVKSAFLYGAIDEEVYVMQPPGFQDPEFPVKVYKVEKAMYGLHQAPRAWYAIRSLSLPEDELGAKALELRRASLALTLLYLASKSLVSQSYVEKVTDIKEMLSLTKSLLQNDPSCHIYGIQFDDTITDYTRPSPSIESNPNDLQNNSSPVYEIGESTSNILYKPEIKFVKAADSPIVIKTNNDKTVRKPSVKYAKIAFQSKLAVRTQVRVLRVPTVNRKFPTVNRKFPTGNSKLSTADLGNKRKAVKPSACWIWRPT